MGENHEIMSGNGNSFVTDIKGIITDGMRNAYHSVHATALITYWRVGRRIVEEEQSGEARAQYGRRLLAGLSAELLVEFGESYSERNLRSYRQFYRLFPDFEIWNARVPNLTWTHFRELLPVVSDDARYSVLHGSKQLFAAKYLTYLPSEEEFRKEIEQQKEIFALQHEGERK